METRVAIIGGTGFYTLFDKSEEMDKITPYGNPSDKIFIGEIEGKGVVFIPRHGRDHSIPPHRVNHKANIWALYELGVKYIFATNSVGIINTKIKPGSFILITDFIDLSSPVTTFYNIFEKNPVHMDFTTPFSESLRKILIQAGQLENIPLVKSAVYMFSKGPRFETASEIKAFKKMGADVVGMTLVPEAVLSKEIGIEYISVGIGTNYAAGISKKELTHEEVLDTMRKKEDELKRLFIRAIKLI